LYIHDYNHFYSSSLIVIEQPRRCYENMSVFDPDSKHAAHRQETLLERRESNPAFFAHLACTKRSHTRQRSQGLMSSNERCSMRTSRYVSQSAHACSFKSRRERARVRVPNAAGADLGTNNFSSDISNVGSS